MSKVPIVLVNLMMAALMAAVPSILVAALWVALTTNL